MPDPICTDCGRKAPGGWHWKCKLCGRTICWQCLRKFYGALLPCRRCL